MTQALSSDPALLLRRRPHSRVPAQLQSKGPGMSEILTPIVIVLESLIDLYKWCLIAMIALSWLINFNVVNPRNRGVYMIADFLNRITEPVLRPIRRRLPDTGALDLSPIVLFVILWLIQMYLPMLLRGI